MVPGGGIPRARSSHHRKLSSAPTGPLLTLEVAVARVGKEFRKPLVDRLSTLLPSGKLNSAGRQHLLPDLLNRLLQFPGFRL